VLEVADEFVEIPLKRINAGTQMGSESGRDAVVVQLVLAEECIGNCVTHCLVIDEEPGQSLRQLAAEDSMTTAGGGAISTIVFFWCFSS
jgi:hypothetical protein